MNVRVIIEFESKEDAREEAMRSMAEDVTDDVAGVRVFAEVGRPGCLVAEFTMPREPQVSAVSKIDDAIQFWTDGDDTTIQFPLSAEERASRDRKNARARERRRARKAT